MKRLALMIFPLFAVACVAVEGGQETEDRRGPLGKADGFGSCESSCGGQSQDGTCWCDEQCAEFGDCCDDAADQCALDECDAVTGAGCAEGELCLPGVCLAFCDVEDPDCCAPNRCEVVNPPITCEALGGSCLSSPFDVTFPADCEQDYGMETGVGECAAFNQSCCMPADQECPEIAPPHPDFCPDGEIVANIDENGCTVGFTCEEPTSCEDAGGFCAPGGVGCPADTVEIPNSCGDADAICCTSIVVPF